MARYPEIFAVLKERIESNFYTERLPSLTALAREFQVNINTIQRAVGELKRFNLVYSINGSGIFISSKTSTPYRKIVTIYMQNFVKCNNPVLYEFIDNLQQELARFDIGIAISMHDALPDAATCQAVLIFTRDIQGEKLSELKNHIMPDKIYYFDCFAPNIQMIGVDNAFAGKEAIEYLYGRGHRKIGVIAYSQVPEISFYERVRGVKAAAVGKKDLKLQIFDLGDNQSTADETVQQKCFEQILNSDAAFDAVFCLTDRLAVQFMVYCQERGVKVPDDISIIGYDNNTFTKLFSPGLTTFEEPYKELAAITARRLVRPLRSIGEPMQILCKPILIERNSVKDKNTQQGD